MYVYVNLFSLQKKVALLSNQITIYFNTSLLLLLLRSTPSQTKQSHSFTNEVASKGIYKTERLLSTFWTIVD